MRLLTDTCSAMKLLAIGDKLFKAGVLKGGDLVLHPRVFAETRKWPVFKKEKYKDELFILHKMKQPTGLRPPSRAEAERLESIVVATMDELERPIGSADRDQIAAAIFGDSEIVTNDDAFAEVAEALDITAHIAEEIVIAAHEEGVLSKEEVAVIRKKWQQNGEKVAPPNIEKKLKTI